MVAKRFGIMLVVNEETYEDDYKFITEWLDLHKNDISYNSDDDGCGCCVNLWEIECDEVMISEIPERMRYDLYSSACLSNIE